MTDHAVLIPTSEGPVGGIVSAPDGEPRAAAVLLQGIGRPARSGINSFWTRLARSLAELGVIALRCDCSREGETLPIGEGVSGQVRRHGLERSLLDQVIPWFHERSGAGDLFLVGACSGGFLAAEQAGLRPALVAGAFLVVPYLSPPREADEAADDQTVDPSALNGVRTVLERGACWIVIGEHDFHLEQVNALRRSLGHLDARLELEVVPDAKLHFLDQPELQRQVRSRLLPRVARALAERGPLVT